MDALTGSWQYENTSSANGISLSPPSSPTLYFEDNLIQSLDLEKELLGLEDASPFLGPSGGAQLLSSANCAIPFVIQPASVSYEYKPIGPEELGVAEIFAPEAENQGIDIDIDSILTGDHDMKVNVEDMSVEISNLHRLLEPSNAPADPALESSAEFPESIADTTGVAMTDMRVGSVEFLQVTQEELRDLIGENAFLETSRSSYAYDEEDSNASLISSLHEIQDIGQLDAELDMDVELAYENFSYLASIDRSVPESSVNSSDAEEEAQDEAVDALLRNDISTAQDLVSTLGTRRVGQRITSVDSDATYKPSRRGRKPANSPPTSWRNVKDKSQRKKQQNRAAASKYRQKKKEEASLIEQREKLLEQEHQALLKQKASLLQEASLIKKLLIEKLAARSSEM